MHIIGEWGNYISLIASLKRENRFSGRYPWAIQDVLTKYGDVVRIAPNELVFMNPQAQIGGTFYPSSDVGD